MAQQRSPPYLDCQVGSATTDAGGDASVSFARAFSGVPKVFLQGVDAAAKGIVLDVVSKSAAGFSVKSRKITGITSGGAVGTVDPTVGGTAYTHSYENHTHTFMGSSGTTGSGGVDHSHGFSGNTAGATGTVDPGVGGTVFATSYDDPGHGHTFTGSAMGTHGHTFTGSGGTTGGPGGAVPTTEVATGGHKHSGTTGGPSATVARSFYTTPLSTKYAATTSGGACTSAFWAITDTYGVNVPTEDHTHNITTGAASATTDVASMTHTHSFTPSGSISSNSAGTPSGSVSSSATNITLTGLYHYHGYSGTTGGASAYSHQHGFTPSGTISASLTLLVNYHYHTSDSPVLSASFDWLAILP